MAWAPFGFMGNVLGNIGHFQSASRGLQTPFESSIADRTRPNRLVQDEDTRIPRRTGK
jgi:hypothetical protein